MTTRWPRPAYVPRSSSGIRSCSSVKPLASTHRRWPCPATAHRSCGSPVQSNSSSTTTLLPTYGAESRSSPDVRVATGEQVVAGLEAEDRRVGDDATDCAGVGIEQQLLRVEAQAALRVPRPFGAEAVPLSHGYAGQCAVPDAEAALGQRVPGLVLGAVLVVEEAHPQGSRVGCVHREVGRSPRSRWRPAGQLRPGQTSTRSSAADHSPGVTPEMMSPVPTRTQR